jgi:hypothetical protein
MDRNCAVSNALSSAVERGKHEKQPYLTEIDLNIQILWAVTVCFGVCGHEISKKKCPNLLRFSGKRGMSLPDTLQTCLRVTIRHSLT